MSEQPRFQKGDNVRIISSSKIGTVNEILIRQNNIGYRVTVNGKTTTYQEKYLEPFKDEEQEIIDNLSMQEYKGVDEFHLFQTWFRLKRPLEGNFYSYLASRTVFNPYQFKPLSKFIAPGSEERLFIADEVGVGKTIETGIILTELIARGRLDRRSPILIICPNSLGPKWEKEMRSRFGLRFHLHDGASLDNALKSVMESGFLPDGAIWAIASLQLIRTKKSLDHINKLNGFREASIWSIVVIDEAHHMRNTGTESNNLGNTLSSLTDMMLMLSATPLNLRDADLFNQMYILNQSMFPDQQTFSAMLSPVKSINRCRRLLAERTHTVYGGMLKELAELESGPLGKAISEHPGVITLKSHLLAGAPITNAEIARYDRTLISLSPLDNSFNRTLKREALEHRVTREPLKVPVEFTSEEMEFHEAVIELAKNAYLARGGSPDALRFVTNMPRRMVSSCIPAMRDYLEWCLINNMELVDEENREEAEDDSEVASRPLPPELREEYIRLRDKAESLGQSDTKYIEFNKLVIQLMNSLDNPQLIVFSFFVRTLRYLQKKLTGNGYRVGLICGDVPLVSDGTQPGRYEIMEAFEKKELDILLSSEVGGEGLDFQFCQAIVNYDLPYNPMRVEQRIGRVDRFGQQAEKVIVASMYIKGTVDEEIYSALYDRIKLVENSVGGLEPILGNKLVDLQRDIVSGQLSKEQLEVRMREIELAVEQARIEMESFESSRRELMGDEYFTSPLHNLENQIDFVQPSDAASLTAIYLSMMKGCGYEATSQDCGKITLSKEVTTRLEQFTRRPGSEGSIEELSPFLKTKLTIPVVFNGSLADQYRDHHFLPPCGFWAKFLLVELESFGKVFKVFAFNNNDKDLPIGPGVYVIPMFEVKLEGFRIELYLAAVPISVVDQEVQDCDFLTLTRLLGKGAAVSHDWTGDMPELEDPTIFKDIGSEALEQQMENKMELLRAENKYRIESRINSLKRGSEVRIERLKRRIKEHQERNIAEGKEPSQEFVRLTEAQISTEERRRDEKIKKLQARSELSLTLSLAGVVICRVFKGE
ncbi:MAG TPA: DNA/RNA helicase, superfamily II [Desulfotomaculum sp.]|nr:MAG: DNA/RNA helicase, superfamily II [Desulfotomaculum sp. 46_296]HAG10718.1 DNA/RNA helicase, superfamily II [Desulfotomaculum sp.]